MKFFSTSVIAELDQYTIDHEPIASVDLMERAAHALLEAINSRFGIDIPVLVFADPVTMAAMH